MIVNFGVSYLAVFVATVVAMVIGFAWYSPQVLGNRWMGYLGTTQAQLGNPGPMGIAVGAVSALLNAWVLAVLAMNLGGTTIGDGVMLRAVNNGHNVIVQILMAAIVTAWR